MRQDRSQITPNIWVGAVPTDLPTLPSKGFSHLALCADEHQFPNSKVDGLDIRRCPLVDIDVGEVLNLDKAVSAAHWVADSAFGGGKVLVTCAAGINRSALVAALALRLLGVSPQAAIDQIQARRSPFCLNNETFYNTVLELNL